MSTIDIRRESHALLDQVDEHFLAAVHALLRTYAEPDPPSEAVHLNGREDEIVGYRVGTDEPLYAKDAVEEFARTVDDVKRGEFVEIDELIEKRSRKW